MYFELQVSKGTALLPAMSVVPVQVLEKNVSARQLALDEAVALPPAKCTNFLGQWMFLVFPSNQPT